MDKKIRKPQKKFVQKSAILIMLRKYWQWLGIILLAVVAFFLGFVGYQQYFSARNEFRSVWDIAYLSFQLFVLEFGSLKDSVPFTLELARFFAVIVAFGTIFKTLGRVFRDQFKLLRVSFFYKSHVIICGLGKKGFQLLKDFRSEGYKVVVVEVAESNDNIRRAEELGAYVFIGNATDRSLLNNLRAYRAEYVIAICGNDETNIEIAVETFHLVTYMQNLKKIKKVVQCFVHIVDLHLCTLFKQHIIFTKPDDLYEVRIVNIYENSARELFREYPLDHVQIKATDPLTVHLVIIGFGQMGEAVALQAAKIGHFANGNKIRITVIDLHASLKKKGFESRYPKFSNICDIKFIESSYIDLKTIDLFKTWVVEENIVMSIAVCLDGDASALSCGLNIQSKLHPHTLPIAVRMSEKTGLSFLVEEEEDSNIPANLHAFGLPEKTFTSNTLISDELDTLAKEIHRYFVEVIKGRAFTNTVPSLRKWKNLDPFYKDSNRQQADHIEVKLRAIGKFENLHTVASYMDDKEYVKDLEVEIDKNSETLAKMEHRRWCAECFLSCWTYGPNKIPELKISPYLIEWDDPNMPNDIKEYDRKAVRNIPHQLKTLAKVKKEKSSK